MRHFGTRRGGFTLLEMMVAVGAVALLAVGLAGIFGSASRTVTAGRRVSALHRYASMIERNMRQDFENMSRDGFLVIRNELVVGTAGPGQPLGVKLHPDEPTRRPRRADEIVFLAEGEFTSARTPLHKDLVARSDMARIYYGHGVRWPEDDVYDIPNLGDTITSTEREAHLGFGNQNGMDGVNEYASDWTLLRHVTLLAPVTSSDQVLPNPPPYGLFPGLLVDSDIQIAGQPAASNLFQSLSRVIPGSGMMFGAIRQGEGLPQFSSGLVDIATTDASEVRSIIMTADVDPSKISSPSDFVGSAGQALPDSVFTQGDTDIGYMQQWMLDALPTESSAIRLIDRKRLRYEPKPRGLLNVLIDPSYSNLQQSYRMADQFMLSSSNFLPGCTEFIVEWSFGDVYPNVPNDPRAGETVWHGLERKYDRDGSGTIDDDEYMAVPYPWFDPSDRNHEYKLPYRKTDGTIGKWVVDPELIHGVGFGGSGIQLRNVLVSYFGYVDPLFDPSDASIDAATPSIDWAWPKLIRVTMNLADPNNPSAEETFQFVFEVPERSGP